MADTTHLNGATIESNNIAGQEGHIRSAAPLIDLPHPLQSIADGASGFTDISITDGPVATRTGSKPKTVASLWHTALVLFILLAPSMFWRPLWKFWPSVRHTGRPLYYTLELEFQWVFFLIVILGPMARGIRVRDLIGAAWHSWRDFFRDLKLGTGVMVSNIIAAIFLAMVLPLGRSNSGILLPKTKADLAVFLLIACTAGFTEEIACRGYLQRQFHALTGSPWMALTIQAAVFSLAHGYDQSMVSLLAKFIAGLSFGIVAVMRRSLLPGILGHACQDCLVGVLMVFVFTGK